MTTPEYVALRTDLRDGTLVDFLSGFSISGNQVVPYPTDPEQQHAVDVRLLYGILVSATQEEYDSQNPVVVPPQAAITLNTPKGVTPSAVPGSPGAFLADCSPASTSVFIIDKAAGDDENFCTLVVFTPKVLNTRFFINAVFLGFETLQAGVGNDPVCGMVLTDGVTTILGEGENVSVIGPLPTRQDWLNGLGFNIVSDGEKFVVGFDRLGAS